MQCGSAGDGYRDVQFVLRKKQWLMGPEEDGGNRMGSEEDGGNKILVRRVLHVLALNPMIGNVTVKCIESERHALLALKHGFHLNNNAWLSSWGHGDNQKECCNWEHIQCSNETGHVLKLDLHVSDHIVRAGSITTALAELHHLNYLDLSYISFNLTPSIAIFVASLTHLRYLNLSHSGFQGKVPHQFGNLLFLEYLDLAYNSLFAEIPPQISNLTNLLYLHLGSNSFHGNIPPQFGSLLSLKYLDLSENDFNGTIPENFGNLYDGFSG
nr:receptor-like protein 43 [Arachis hypogaea]